MNWSENKKNGLWLRIVSNKIRNQSFFINKEINYEKINISERDFNQIKILKGKKNDLSLYQNVLHF